MSGLRATSRNFALRPVTAVLGPTNTGKTHYALERMTAYGTGMIGLPLRLLAREVYDRLAARLGSHRVALMTGEEKIIPQSAPYWVCTVEAMPLEREVEFLAVDEIQLAHDPERGRIFTHRLLHARGTQETLFLGSDTMAQVVKQLVPDIGFVARPRFSALTYAGGQKLSRLPRRTAIVAFSTDAVYTIAELIKRQHGGAAVIMGALSPRTRNAQAALYQNGDVDYLVATDAIGMGLNLDIAHVAFAGARKFDGRQMRALSPAELAQIAGRAGRHIKDGSFGTTGDCPAFSEDVTEAIEHHQFDPVRAVQWRAHRLDFSSPTALLQALGEKPGHPSLLRAREDDDEAAFRRLVKQRDIADFATGGAALKLLWEVCQIPDFRRVTLDQHTHIISEIYLELITFGHLRESWIAPRIERFSRPEGDVDALSHRLAHIRTWTYLCHRASWVENAPLWQARARHLEQALSDRLHEKLTQRFIDRRTSVLLKKLHDTHPLLAGVAKDGEVTVEGEFVGRLIGFDFILDPRAKGPNEKAIRHAATKALQPVLMARAGALMAADDADFFLKDDGTVVWRQSVIAALEKGALPFRPSFRLRTVEQMPPHTRPRIEDRVERYLATRLEGLLAPLYALHRALNKPAATDGKTPLSARARAVAFQLCENFGALPREQIVTDIKALSQDDRAALRQLGLRFGEFTLYLPALLKPAPAQLLSLLWALWHDRDIKTLNTPGAGLTSAPLDEDQPPGFAYAAGYRPSGNRIVRIDMIERLGEQIRLARQTADMRDGFEATPHMMSLIGCAGEPFAGVLKSLGFRENTIPRKRMKALDPGGLAETKERRHKRHSFAEENQTNSRDALVEGPDKSGSVDRSQPTDTDVSFTPVSHDTETPLEAATSVPILSEQPGPDAAPAGSRGSAPDNASDNASDNAPDGRQDSRQDGGPDSRSDNRKDGPPDTGSGTIPESDAAPEAELETVTLWKRAPRPGAKTRRPAKPRKDGQDSPPRKRKSAATAPQKGPRRFSSEKPAKDRKADPDSPFAILGDLTRSE